MWRKLRQAGAICYQQGVAVLPMNLWNRTFLEELRSEIHGFDGEASILRFSFTDERDEQKLVAQFNEQVRSACQKMSEGLSDLLREMENPSALGYLRTRKRTGFFEKARSHYESFKRHGFFQAPLDQSVGHAVESLLAKIENYIRSFDLVK